MFSQGRRLLAAMGMKAPQTTSSSGNQYRGNSSKQKLDTERVDSDSDISSFTPSEAILLNPKWIKAQERRTRQVTKSPSLPSSKNKLRPSGKQNNKLVDYSSSQSSRVSAAPHRKPVPKKTESVAKVQQWLLFGDTPPPTNSASNDNDSGTPETSALMPQPFSNSSVSLENISKPAEFTKSITPGANVQQRTEISTVVLQPLDEELTKLTQSDANIVQTVHITPATCKLVPQPIANNSVSLDIVTPDELKKSTQTAPSVRKRLFNNDDDLYPDIDFSHDAILLPLDDTILMENVVTIEATSDEVVHSEIFDTNASNVIVLEDAASNVIAEENLFMNGNNFRKRKRNNTPEVNTPPKKRQANPSKWLKSQAKLANNSGVAHVSLRGKEKKAREMKESCKCRRKCGERISENARRKQFEKYWGLKNKLIQWYFITKQVDAVEIKQRKVNNEDRDQPYRKKSYEYFLLDENSVRIPVCQVMFLNTFDVSITVVKSALLKNIPDKRGKHVNRKRMSLALVQSVKDHIRSFPMVESHYCRADTRRKYLDEKLCVAQMHRLYLMGREKTSDVANQRQYRDIFNTCFNLGFFRPKKDQCSLCADWNSLKEEEKQANEEKSIAYTQHIQSKEKVRALRREDKDLSRDKDATAASGRVIRVLTFDLQKVLYAPKAELGELFYKRKLSCYNFTIFDCTLKQGYCYVWDQTVAKRGSDEMTSFVRDHISTAAEKGVTEIIIYSDSCSGQNKNQFLFSMYSMAASKYKIKIVHRYLEKGHTQMECDSMHARIEKKTRKLDVYTSQQWYGHIRAAKVKKPQYQVKEVKQSDIYSFKEIAQQFQWSKVPISKLKEIVFSHLKPGLATYRISWDSEGTEVDIRAKKPGRRINPSTYKFKAAYSGRLALKPKLVQDLKWILQKELIPQAHRNFYERIIQAPDQAVDINAENEDEGDDEDDVPQEIAVSVNAMENLLESEHQDDDIDDELEELDVDHPSSAEKQDSGNTTDSDSYD